MIRIRASEEVGEAWNRTGIRYCVLHGLEDYPHGLGRDLDVLVAADDLTRATAIARQILSSRFSDVVRPPPVWGERLIAVEGQATNPVTLEIHLVTEVRWRNVVLASSPQPGCRTGPFSVDRWAAFAKRILLPMLDSGADRFRTRPGQLDVAPGEVESLRSRLFALVDATMGRSLTRAVVDRDLDAIDRLGPELRRHCSRRAWRNEPVKSVARLAASAWSRLSLPFRPCAPIIAVVGPDGVGKSTILGTLARGDLHVFNNVVIRHWRPGLLPPLSEVVGRSDRLPTGASRPPRREPGRFHFLRLAYYAVDYLFGGYLKDRIASSRQHLVLYDRCMLDMAVDPVRYGLQSDRGVRTLYRWLPGPDRIVLISDSPVRIHTRKGEITVEEIDRQLSAWESLQDDGQVGPTLQADAPPQVLAERLMSIVMSNLVEVNERGEHRNGHHPSMQAKG